MSIDLLLRALRGVERSIYSEDLEARFLVVGQGAYDYDIDHEGLEAKRKSRRMFADKIHKKIVERFEKMKQAGKDLYLDKWVREQQENLRHLGE